jgi:hypothetical protein
MPVGSIRNRTVERILESLQVACKNASHGCKEVFKLSTRARRKHEEEECEYRSLKCPVKGCGHRGSTVTMPRHLTKEHGVPTVESNEHCGTLRIRLHPSEDYVMVRSAKQELFLLHRREGRITGSSSRDDSVDSDLFFCASFGARHRKYGITVKRGRHSRAYSMTKVLNIRDLNDHVPDHLVVPRRSRKRPRRSYDVLISDLHEESDTEESESESSEDEKSVQSEDDSDPAGWLRW